MPYPFANSCTESSCTEEENVQRNAVGVKDALGNETDLSCTIGNASLQTVLPATGQTESGHGRSLTG